MNQKLLVSLLVLGTVAAVSLTACNKPSEQAPTGEATAPTETTTPAPEQAAPGGAPTTPTPEQAAPGTEAPATPAPTGEAAPTPAPGSEAPKPE